MNKFLTVAILGASIAAMAPAEARNVKYMIPISAALQSPAAEGKLDSSVKLFFGPQMYGNGTKSGTAEASGKTRIENKVDAASCQASFVEALQALQKSAKAVGKCVNDNMLHRIIVQAMDMNFHGLCCEPVPPDKSCVGKIVCIAGCKLVKAKPFAVTAYDGYEPFPVAALVAACW